MPFELFLKIFPIVVLIFLLYQTISKNKRDIQIIELTEELKTLSKILAQLPESQDDDKRK